MLSLVVGHTGSGKSLWTNYLIFVECTRIANKDRSFNWFQSFLGDTFNIPYYQYSYYDLVCTNANFNDGKGNFTRMVYNLGDCSCGKYTDDSFVKHWDSGGFVEGISDLPDVYDKNNRLIFIDEGGTQLANRDWDKMDENYVLFLTTHRHNVTGFNRRFDIFVSSQHGDLIEITLRRLANKIYMIRPLFGYSRNPTRPSWLRTMPAIKIWVYWKHELLQRPPYVEMGETLAPEDQVESLETMTWLWIGKSYRTSYDSIGKVHAMKRIKKK